MGRDHTTVVTISRQLASGGAFIGQTVARRLGMRYVDREILDRAAAELAIAPEDAAHHDERELAAGSDAVIVGRCGCFVLRDHPGLIKVFVHADTVWRVQRVMTAYSLTDPRAARDLIETSDEQRAGLHRAVAGGDWPEARSYDLCLDTGRLGLDTAAEMVVQLVDLVEHRSG